MAKIIFHASPHMKIFRTSSSEINAIHALVTLVQGFLPGMTYFTKYTTANATIKNLHEIEMTNSFFKKDLELEFYYSDIQFSNQDDVNPAHASMIIIRDYSTVRELQSSPSLTVTATGSGYYIPPTPATSYHTTVTIGGSTYDYNPNPIPQCEHGVIDVGFNQKNMVCKFCNKDMN